MDAKNKNDQHGGTRVGYCNPPTHSRFQKGKSGNPHGRSKGTLNVGTVLERTLRERVIVNEDGVRKTVTKLEAALKQLVNKSASGELKAIQLLAALVRVAEESAPPERVSNAVLNESDEKVMLNILQRIQNATKGKEDEIDAR
jgi:hypothetical protein